MGNASAGGLAFVPGAAGGTGAGTGHLRDRQPVDDVEYQRTRVQWRESGRHQNRSHRQFVDDFEFLLDLRSTRVAWRGPVRRSLAMRR